LDCHSLTVEIHVLDVQSDSLRSPQAAAIEDREQGCVTSTTSE
jgi:hypothetical protein